MKNTDVDQRVRVATEHRYQALIDAELTAFIGAGPHERTPDRTGQRNGSRARTLTTTARDLELRIPKLQAAASSRCCWSGAAGSTRRCSRSRWTRTCTASTPASSTTSSKPSASRICAHLEEEVATFRDRPLEVAFPCVFLDATYCKARVNKRVVSQAVAIAADGHREFLGFAVAKVPGPLHAQRPGPGAQGQQRDGSPDEHVPLVEP